MKTRQKITAWLAGACLLGALLTGCGSTNAQQQTGSGTIDTGSGEPVVQADKNVQAVASFSLAYNENDGLDPLACTSEENKLLSQLCFERLFLLNEKFEPQMELCASIQRNNAKSYTLTIREGVKFHSGEEVKPSDVVYSLNNARLRDDSTYQDQLSCISSVKYSGNEIYIRLNTAKSEKALEALLDVPIFCKGSEDDDIPDGSGPYKIVKSDDGGLRAVPFDQWSGGVIGFCDSITLQPIADSAGAVNLLGTGQLSMLMQKDAEDTAATGAKYTKTVGTSRMHYLGINCDDAPLDNKNVRTALSMLMDRATIAQTCFAGRADATSLPVANVPSEVKAPAFDQEAAMKLLKKAGIYDRDNDGYLEIRGGSDFKLQIIYNKQYGTKGAVLEQYAKTLNEMGIQTKVIPLEFETCQSRLSSGRYQMYYGEYEMTSDFDLSDIISRNGDRNFGDYRSADMTSALNDLNNASEEDYDTAYQTYLTCFAEETPIIPIVFERRLISAVEDFPKGFDPWPDQIFHGMGNWSAT